MPFNAAQSSTVRRRPPLGEGANDQWFQRRPQFVIDFASCHTCATILPMFVMPKKKMKSKGNFRS
jgi:hypothetical protein